MVSIPKVIGILSCGFLLFLGLANAVQAEHAPSSSDVMKTDHIDDRQGLQSDDDKQMNEKMQSSSAKGSKMMKGELFRIESGNYFVKVKDGKEFRLHTDKTTLMSGEAKKGDRIEAQINNKNHTLSIRKAEASH